MFLDTYFKEPDKDIVTMVDNSEFEHVKVLESSNFINLKLELEFVKLILAKSPVLKKVWKILYKMVTKDEGLKLCKISQTVHVLHLWLTSLLRILMKKKIRVTFKFTPFECNLLQITLGH